jgi:predicted dehydrogenase
MIACELLKRNFPLILQKPVALNLNNTLLLKDIIENHNALVLVDHTYLFHPAFEKLKELVSREPEITGIQSRGTGWGPFRRNCDPLWDWGPHDISMCLAILQEFPESVEVEDIKSMEMNGTVGKIITVRLDFPSGVIANLKLGNISKKRERTFVVQSNDKRFIFDDCSDNKLRITTSMSE